MCSEREQQRALMSTKERLIDIAQEDLEITNDRINTYEKQIAELQDKLEVERTKKKEAEDAIGLLSGYSLMHRA